jgi:hypothetical protein
MKSLGEQTMSLKRFCILLFPPSRSLILVLPSASTSDRARGTIAYNAVKSEKAFKCAVFNILQNAESKIRKGKSELLRHEDVWGVEV